MEISIFECDEKDIPFVLELYRNSLDKEKPVLTAENAIPIWKKMSQYPDYNIFIAKYGEIIVGTFALLIMDNLAHFGTPSAIIEDVAVNEKYQNQGIGKKMMEYAIKLAKKKGCYKMVLSSNLKRIEAHRFYEHLGFEKHGFSFAINL
jgi:GNAT superfamily N-acetyltransferase